MKKTIILSLLILPMIINGQSIKKIKNKLDGNRIEIFYALKTDNSIKQGLYKLNQNGITIEKGNYNNNYKDGEWEIYHKNGAKSAEGAYENGKRIKIWKFYNNKNELIQTYDFEKELLNNEGPFKNKELGFGSGKYKGLLFTDKPPTFEGGNIEIANFIKSNFNYSKLRKLTDKKGKIFVGATLLENGELKDVKVLRGIDELLDEEAERVTKLMKGKWKPAEFEGEKLTKKIVIPFTII